MAPLVAMAVGSIIRTVLTAAGSGIVTVAAAPAVTGNGTVDAWQAAIGALIVAVAQIWSLVQKSRVASAQ